ncbi:MAG TPA: endolytic transglycosylase MltG [Syntrophales bacterium]|nr:endolytic transglycosylase MltG [Syntrophales bacterium]
MKPLAFFRRYRLPVFTIFAAAGILSALWLLGALPYPVTQKDDIVTVFIPRGTSFPRVVNLLDEKGLIRSRLAFRAMAWFTNAPQQIKAGEYEFPRAMTAADILQKLIHGDVKFYRIVVPEGFTVRLIADRLGGQGLVNEKEFLRLARDREFLATLQIPTASAEGFLFPDTYNIDRTMDARTIMKMMAGQFWTKVTSEMIAKANAQKLSLKDWVTLASIIEKETGRKDEMPLVSAVFHNRLRIKMPLQSDPTVIYGIENFDGNLTRKHLERQNPYNSYLNRGLPPGPICNPGLDALSAALNPAPVHYFYFVSRNDGSHQFSVNLAEHNRAVRKYQIIRNSSGN